MDAPGSLDRVPIRTRESPTTRSAWRLRTATPAGEGAIVRVDGEREPLFRGEGAFLGWPQDRLAAEYARLLPKERDPAPDPGQFG